MAMIIVEEYQQRTKQDIQRRNMEIQARSNLLVQTEKRTPAKTLSAIAGKIKEYIAWCNRQGYSNELVTDDKAIVCLCSIKNRNEEIQMIW